MNHDVGTAKDDKGEKGMWLFLSICKCLVTRAREGKK